MEKIRLRVLKQTLFLGEKKIPTKGFLNSCPSSQVETVRTVGNLRCLDVRDEKVTEKLTGQGQSSCQRKHC